MPGWILWFFVVGTGACIGSFLNVCVHRLPRHLSIVHPRSACPGCGTPIAWYDNIPVLSYLLLRGRCRRCATPISPRYPLVEMSTALLFALLYGKFGPSFACVDHAVLSSALVGLIVIDGLHQILPNAITLPGIVVGLLLSPLRADSTPHPVRDAVLGAFIGFVVLWSINAAYLLWQAVRGVPKEEREDGIGQGDFKLLAMIGAFLGLKLVLFTLFFGAISGALYGMGLILFRGQGWKSKLPYGVFLGGAAIVGVFFGEAWMSWYASTLGIGP